MLHQCLPTKPEKGAMDISMHAHEKHEHLISLCKSLPPTPTAFGHPYDQSCLQAVVDATRAGPTVKIKDRTITIRRPKC